MNVVYPTMRLLCNKCDARFSDRCETDSDFLLPVRVGCQRVALPRRVARLYPAYGLYLYGEGLYAQETRALKLTGAPVLFLPGNAGSYKQGALRCKNMTEDHVFTACCFDTFLSSSSSPSSLIGFGGPEEGREHGGRRPLQRVHRGLQRGAGGPVRRQSAAADALPA